MNTLELAYDRGSMFGRDLFHYGMSAIVFLFCVFSPYGLGLIMQFIEPTELKVHVDTWEKFGLTVCLVILLYALGHVLLVLGYLYRNLFEKTLRGMKVVKNLARAEEHLKTLATKEPSRQTSGLLYSQDVHLACEMSAFHRFPDVHARFIERYNTLAFLRLGLASSMLTGGLSCAVFLSVLPIAQVLPFVILWTALGGLLLRQHLITQTGFLNRVAAAYALSEPSET